MKTIRYRSPIGTGPKRRREHDDNDGDGVKGAARQTLKRRYSRKRQRKEDE